MQDIQPELIEKYQILLQKDPKSQVFAPLTEAYRKMGLIEEALRIAVRGVQFNPNFGGGRIALAKVFLDRENLPGAVDELVKAVDLSPDNILAHSLLGECFLKEKRPKDALRSFKMVLYLAPANEKAQKAVRKLEALTADEYDDDLFEMKQLPQLEPQRMDAATPLKPVLPPRPAGELERVLSLSDAYIIRNDLHKASEVLKQGELDFGAHPELVKRSKLVNQRGFPNSGSPVSATAAGTKSGEVDEAPLPSRAQALVEHKIELLQNLLRRVQEHSGFT